MKNRFFLLLISSLLMLTSYAANEFVSVGRCSIPPQIDGKLNDVAWENSLEISNFISLKTQGAPVSRQSQFYLCYDDEFLYIAIRCFEEMLDPVLNQTQLFQAKAEKRDDPQIWRDDLVEFFLAPNPNNTEKYFHFAVNSKGAVWDTITTGQADQWNAVCKAAGTIFVDASRTKPENAGWSCEIALQLNSLGIQKILPGDRWKGNFCRVTQTNKESSSWCQTGGRFHDPAVFGTIEFQDRSERVAEFSPIRDIKNGLNYFSGQKHPDYQIILEADFGNEHVVEFRPLEIDQKGFNIAFKLDNQNQAYRFKSDELGDKTETFLRSGALNLTAKQKYLLQVRYRGQYQAQRVSEKGYTFLTLLQPTPKYQALPLYFPFDTQNKWLTLNGTFENGDDTSGNLWGLKWTARQISGTIELDDIQIIDVKTGRNLLQNGDFAQEANHWNIFARENLVEGYGFQAEKVKLQYRVLDAENKTRYVSSTFHINMATEFAAISSRLVQFGDHGLIPLDRLHIASNSVERVNLLLRSQQRESLEQVTVELSMPEAIRLLPMGQRPLSLPGARSIQETFRQQDQQGVRVYQLTFGPECINDANAASNLYFGIPLFFTTDTPAIGVVGTLEMRASYNNQQQEPIPQRLTVEVLEPLRGKQPNPKLPLILWVYPSQTKQMSDLERQFIHEKIADSGYNMVSGNVSESQAFRPLGIHTFPMLPSLTISGPYFPGLQAFLRQNPELAGINAQGQASQSIDPAVVLSNDNPFLPQFKQVLRRFLQDFPDEMHVDYEFPFMPRQPEQLPQSSGAIGFSNRNLKLFQKQYSIPDSELTPKEIFAKHSDAWLDFRSRQVADTLGLYKKVIHEISPATRFSVYSGYPPQAGHHYGIDWKYVAPQIDLCMVGYGGNDALMLQSIPQNFYNSGLLLMGFVDQSGISNTYTSMLTTAGSFMGYVHYTVDGLYFWHSSIVAEIAADFETFFLNRKRSRHDALTVDAANDKTRGDVMTFEWEQKRLILTNNRNNTAQQYHLRTANAQNMLAIDHESKTVLPDSSLLEFAVPANRPRAIALLSKEELLKLSAAVPEQLRCDKRKFPIIRWTLPSDIAAFSCSELRYAYHLEDLEKAKIQRCAQQYFQVPENSAGRRVYCQIRSRLPDDRISSWSQALSVGIPELALFEQIASAAMPQQPAEQNLGSWMSYSWSGGAQMARFYIEPAKAADEKGYSLHIENEFDSTQSYWTTFRPSLVLGPLPELEPGKLYEFSAQLQQTGSISATIGLRVLDRNAKVVQQTSSQAIADADGWLEHKVSLTASPEARYATFMFSGAGGPGTCIARNLTFTALP